MSLNIDELIYSLQNSRQNTLRYGENPHQKAVFIGNLDNYLEQMNGKELSYNNLLDIDSAIALVREFNEPVFAIIKHNNVCGIASSEDAIICYKKALAADPISAFGGIFISNRNIDIDLANEIDKIFFEILIFTTISDDALNILSSKKNRILLKIKDSIISPNYYIRSVLNGILVQELDKKEIVEQDLVLKTSRISAEREINDLIFANKIVKHLKSNAIAIVKDMQLLGMGCGQTSRIDALKQAIDKAKQFGFDLKDSVMSSDAFFPFCDAIELAKEVGISAIIEPGGSIRDAEVIEASEKNNISLYFTGTRHFRH